MQTNIYYAVKFEHPESKKFVYVQSSKIIYNGSTVNSINVQITTDITEAFLYKQFEQAQEVVDMLPSVYKNIQAEIFKVEKMIDGIPSHYIPWTGGKEMEKLYVVMVINQGKGSKGAFYLNNKEGITLASGVENAYVFKDQALAKQYADEVEGNYPEYDLVVSVQEVRLSAEGIKLDDVDENEKTDTVTSLVIDKGINAVSILEDLINRLKAEFESEMTSVHERLSISEEIRSLVVLLEQIKEEKSWE